MQDYLMTTEEHLAATVKGESKAAQQMHAKARNASQTVLTSHEKTPALPGFAGDCELLQSTEVAGTGFEPATLSPRKTAIVTSGGAENGAVRARNLSMEIDLQLVIDGWPTLNPTMKSRIVAMVRAAGD